MAFLCPTSYGEALDLLTILEIKRECIHDPVRKAAVQRDYTELSATVRPFKGRDAFHYEKLLEVNRIMWNIQEVLHGGTFRDKEHEYELMKQLAVENQRRFRLKRTLNTVLGSRASEQKGYAGKRLFLLHHLGLGDHLFMNGAIRFLATYYDEVCVVVKRQNAATVRALFADEPAVTFYEVKEDADISPLYGCPMEQFQRAVAGFNSVQLCGSHIRTGTHDDFPRSFYAELGIPFECFTVWSHIPITVPCESWRSVPTVFYHTCASDGTVEIPVDLEEKLVLNPDRNLYPIGHRWYESAAHWVGRPFLEYAGLLQEVSELKMVDSSFFCMAILLGRRPEVWTRRGHSYRNICPDLVEHPVAKN